MTGRGSPREMEIIRIAFRFAGFPQELCHAPGSGAPLPRAGRPRASRPWADLSRKRRPARKRVSDCPTATRSVQNANAPRRESSADYGFAASASLFIRSSVLGPMPLIARRSSHRVKDLLPVRALTMRSASTGPTPGRRTSESFGAEEKKIRGFRRKSGGTSLPARPALARFEGSPEAIAATGDDTARRTGIQ